MFGHDVPLYRYLQTHNYNCFTFGHAQQKSTLGAESRTCKSSRRSQQAHYASTACSAATLQLKAAGWNQTELVAVSQQALRGSGFPCTCEDSIENGWNGKPPDGQETHGNTLPLVAPNSSRSAAGQTSKRHGTCSESTSATLTKLIEATSLQIPRCFCIGFVHGTCGLHVMVASQRASVLFVSLVSSCKDQGTKGT